MLDTIERPITYNCYSQINSIRQKMQLKFYIKLTGITWKVTTNGQWLPLSPTETIDIKLPFIYEHTHFNDIIRAHFNKSEILTG